VAELWVWDPPAAGVQPPPPASAPRGDAGTMTLRKVTYTPALYKIFDEVLVNACDARARDPTCDRLDVDVDLARGTVSVKNGGRGVPVEMHATEGCWVPELIFGHLLTSSNYDDAERKTTGGRNGYGAKLCNVFSTEFTVETADGAGSGRRYRQTWRRNMTDKGEATVEPCPKTENWTRVTFAPDLVRLGMPNGLDADAAALFARRAIDAAGCVGAPLTARGRRLRVFLGGREVGVRSFGDYAALYLGPPPPEDAKADPKRRNAAKTGRKGRDAASSSEEDDDDSSSASDADDGGSASADPAAPGCPRAHLRSGDRWEVVAAASENGQFQHVSFVNGVATPRGGTHVAHVADLLVTRVMDALAKPPHKIKNLKAFQVRNHLRLFINCRVENPAFDSQTKETLTLRADRFGSAFEPTDAFVKQVLASGVVDAVLRWHQNKLNRELKKAMEGGKDGRKSRRLRGFPKLDDANEAGGPRSLECTLVLTEGDSAKALAVSGLSVVGRDRFGVFPLRGKLLNVREASHAQILANAEIQAITKILGLTLGKVYSPDHLEGLRYGHLMLMTDQDHDGSHIKGLVLNFLHHFYPSLLKLPGFLLEFITPIVRAVRAPGRGAAAAQLGDADAAGREIRTFYTMPEYDKWRAETPGAAGRGGGGWLIKYYKGLGTSTAREAKAYFADMANHVKALRWGDDRQCGDALDLAFSKKRADDRKAWIEGYVEGTYRDLSQASATVHDFVHTELVLFSRADVERSIPSAIDGLKPGQRKVLFGCFKRGLTRDVKVAQLVGYVAEHSAYHHGEASLTGTIIGLAQDFVGANNAPLLVPSGQFGTRLQGGKDAASPRYVYTRLSRLARALFPAADDELLPEREEEGQRIEPPFYVPVVPLALLNGCDGIGTGWSTQVPSYRPRDVIENVRRLLNGLAPEALDPWFRGWTGTVAREDRERRGKGGSGAGFSLLGRCERVDDERVIISELPPRRWTQDYKEFLESLMDPAGTAEAAGRAKGVADKVGSTAAAKAKAAKAKEAAAKKARAAARAVKASAGDGDDDAPAAGEALIEDFVEHHTDSTVRFEVTMTPAQMRNAERVGLHKFFKLEGTVTTTNMWLFDAAGRIRRYGSPEEILLEHFPLRLRLCERRRQAQLSAAEDALRRLDNRARFVTAVVAGRIVVSGRPRAAIEADLDAAGFDRLPRHAAAAGAGGRAGRGGATSAEADGLASDDEADGAGGAPRRAGGGGAAGAGAPSFHYLLGMPLWSLTREQVEKIREEATEQERRVAALRATNAAAIWRGDLDALEDALDAEDETQRRDAAAEVAAARLAGAAAIEAARKKRGGRARTAAPVAGGLVEVGAIDAAAAETEAAAALAARRAARRAADADAPRLSTEELLARAADLAQAAETAAGASAARSAGVPSRAAPAAGEGEAAAVAAARARLGAAAAAATGAESSSDDEPGGLMARLQSRVATLDVAAAPVPAAAETSRPAPRAAPAAGAGAGAGKRPARPAAKRVPVTVDSDTVDSDASSDSADDTSSDETDDGAPTPDLAAARRARAAVGGGRKRAVRGGARGAGAAAAAASPAPGAAAPPASPAAFSPLAPTPTGRPPAAKRGRGGPAAPVAVAADGADDGDDSVCDVSLAGTPAKPKPGRRAAARPAAAADADSSESAEPSESDDGSEWSG